MAKDIIMACLFIGILLAILFEVAETESVEQTTQIHGNASHNITCQFNISNLDQVKQQFFDFVAVEKASLVFFNIEINQDFLNFTSYDNIHKNGILRWLWVAESQLYILSYPIDLDGITLQLTKSAERTVQLNVNAELNLQRKNDSNYTVCIQSLYQTIFDQILDKNKTDWKFCNRYFEGQHWKHILYFCMGSWLGYDFQCFNSFCVETECADIVKKGTVNIVIDICILLVCWNLPLFYLFLPRRQIISSDEVMNYYKGESPYSIARWFLRLNKSTNSPKCDRRKPSSKKFSDWMKQLMEDSNYVKPEAKILTIFWFILIGIYVIEKDYLRQVISDFDTYTDIYHPHNFSIEDYFNTTQWNVVWFFISSMCISPMLLAYMSYYGQSKNTLISIHPCGIIDFDDIGKEKDEDMKYMKYMEYTGYTQFAMKFLSRISFFFNKHLWMHTISLPHFPERCPMVLSYPIYISYLLVVTPLNIILYTLALLLPMFHFLFDCFLLCPLKFCATFTSKGVFAAILALLQWSVMIAYLVFALRPYFFFEVQFGFRLIVYTMFVAGPLFSTSVSSFTFWAIYLAAIVYFLKYTLTFYSNYKYLLDKIIDLKYEMKKEKDNITKKTEASSESEPQQYSHESINKHPKKSLEWPNVEGTTLEVELFDLIARELVPLNVQVFILFLKVFFTGLFLYVTYDSMKNGGDEHFVTSNIPLIITVIIPGVAERLFSPSNIKDDIVKHEDAIKSMIKDYDNSRDKKVVHSTEMQSPTNIRIILDGICHGIIVKMFVLFCPMLYTLKSIIAYTFVCSEQINTPVPSRYCPEDLNFCNSCTFSRQDEDAESRPSLISTFSRQDENDESRPLLIN